MDRRHQGLRRTLGCLALLGASLSLAVAAWFESLPGVLVALWASPVVVLVVALVLARSEPRVGRTICGVIAGVAVVQLAVVAVDAAFLEDPTGLTSVIWSLLLATATAFLSVVLFVAQPSMTTSR